MATRKGRISSLAGGGSSGGSLPVTTVTVDTVMTVNTAYVCNSASLLAMKLPATCAVGDLIRIVGNGTGKFKVVTNASAATQKINRDAVTSNVSSSSVIDVALATNTFSVIDLECVIGANIWTVINDISTTLVADKNWWGTGADLDTIISVNTDLTSTLDGDVVVKNYGNLTINTGTTLSVSNRCRGAILYVKGNLVIDGKISMTGKGAAIDPSAITSSDGNAVTASGIIFRRVKSGGAGLTNSGVNLLFGAGNAALNSELLQAPLTITTTGDLFTWAKVGGAGGSYVQANGDQFFNGNVGGTGTGMSGGGGSGGAFGSGASGNALSGSGGAGTCWSGGAGGGGCSKRSPGGGAFQAGNGSSFGGAGGNAYDIGGAGGASRTGGGAGNAGGSGLNGGANGSTGTGGSIAIIVRGTITINATGVIESEGANGGSGSGGNTGGGGGASGGGNILILSAGTYTNLGSVTASGGIGGPSDTTSNGANGGAGNIQQAIVDL